MASLRYYLGPLIADTAGRPVRWRAPAGVVGMVDLGTLSDCAADPTRVSARAMAFLAAERELPSEYALLGQGDLREIATDAKMRSAWRSVAGVHVQGDRLVDLLWSHLTDGADPEGLAACPPLVPTIRGDLELWLPGHSLVKSEPFTWGQSHTTKLVELIKRDLTAIRQRAIAGECRDRHGQVDREFHRRVLQATIEKYARAGLPPGQWRQLVPAEWTDGETPKPHSTTLTESWPNDGSLDTTAEDLTWSDTYYQPAAATGGLVYAYTQGWWHIHRAEHDLSSSDMSAAGPARRAWQDCYMGSCIRFYTNAVSFGDCTFYWGGYAGATNSKILKCVAGSFTELDSDAVTYADDQQWKAEADGSTITAYQDGVARSQVTDTSITGNTRAGIGLLRNGANPSIGAWQAGDLAEPPAEGSGEIVGVASITGAGARASEGTGQVAAVAAIAGAGARASKGSGSVAAIASIAAAGQRASRGSGVLAGVAQIIGAGSSGHVFLPPGRVAAAAVRVPGAEAGRAWLPGSTAAGLYLPGAVAGDAAVPGVAAGHVDTPGAVKGRTHA